MNTPRLYQIGQFSTLTRITVKALRHYHELGILSPVHIDEQSGYRYYSEKQLEKAHTIQTLKALQFSLKEIAEIMKSYNEDIEMVRFLKSKTGELASKIETFSKIKQQLELIIEIEEKEAMKQYEERIEVRQIPEQLIASIRYRGKYSQIGEAFRKLFKTAGFQARGKPGALYYDREYKESDADIEAFIPLKREINDSETNVRKLSGGKAHCLIHIGPYEALTRSYKRMLDYIEENGIDVKSPSREVYLKGPGMIFKGKPEKYVTELQFFENDV